MNIENPKPGTTKRTATGGLITYTTFGIIHTAGNNYTGDSSSDAKQSKSKDDDWDL